LKKSVQSIFFPLFLNNFFQTKINIFNRELDFSVYLLPKSNSVISRGRHEPFSVVAKSNAGDSRRMIGKRFDMRQCFTSKHTLCEGRKKERGKDKTKKT